MPGLIRLSGRLAWIAGIVAFLYCPSSPRLSEATERVSGPEWQKGITFTHEYNHQSNLLSARSRASLRYIKSRLNAEWIALNPFGYQHAFDDPNVYMEADPPDDHLIQAIRDAHQLGLKVMLKPHIWLRDRSQEKWRGAIEMRSELRWEDWFADYERFILHYARIAAAEGVDMVCVGTELTLAATTRTFQWQNLIGKVRQAYDGPLVYAANWWAEYDRIEFWKDLDYVGINAFFPLSDSAAPSLAELKAGATAVADRIEALSLRTGKPVIFTEIGFKSVRGTSINPWRWTRREDAVDMAAQERCYQAVFEVFWNRSWFYGMYWWKWYSDLDQGGPDHSGFTPRRKPAEEILAQWYRKPIPTSRDDQAETHRLLR
jgi:hypothetical protein